MAKLLDLKGRNVLVTGGAGFIGSELSRQLVRKGANVVIYDNFLYGNGTNIKELIPRANIVKGDVLSWKVYGVIKDYKIDYVFHLAAEPYIPHSYDNPEKFFDVNTKGTINLLMACKTLGVSRIVCFSTSEVYGTAQYVPMDESHPTLPRSTYAVSKLAADRICYVFHHEHNLPVLIVRPFNCYGPRETQPYIVPEIITQLSKGNTVKLGNIKAKRDLTYVEDTVDAVIRVMESDIPYGEVVNIGSGLTYSVEELARMIGSLMGHDSINIVVEKSRLRPLDVNVLQCDFSKLKKWTGWRPKTKLETGLAKTIDWFEKNGKSWSWEHLV
jgi:nucleoside-diphosphate-sugar epimerase